jgi:hypothetical protein
VSSEFKDITITGLATERTRQSDRAEGLRHMFLKLSVQPAAEWAQIFKAERQFPRHNTWRKAWIEGDSIVVDCVPEELETHHLKDLQVDLANTNLKYRDYLAKVEAQDRREQEAQAKENERLEDLKGRLKF